MFAKRSALRTFFIFHKRSTDCKEPTNDFLVNEAIQDQNNLYSFLSRSKEEKEEKEKEKEKEKEMWDDLFAAHCSGPLALSFYEWGKKDRDDAWQKAMDHIDHYRRNFCFLKNKEKSGCKALAHLLVLLAKNVPFDFQDKEDEELKKEKKQLARNLLEQAIQEIDACEFPKEVADVFCAAARYFCRQELNSGLNVQFREVLESLFENGNDGVQLQEYLNFDADDDFFSRVQRLPSHAQFIVAAISGILSTQAMLPESVFLNKNLLPIKNLSWSLC